MKSSWRVLISILILITLEGGLAGCAASGEEPESPAADAAVLNATRVPVGGVISQWGTSAEGSSEFANPEWGASQAVGSPDVPGCGDYQFAWASAASDSIATLEVSFSRAVYPLEIFIHESFNPDQVVKVEVLNPDTGAYYTVLQKNPVQIDRPCPYVLDVVVGSIDFKTDRVRITVDQSQLGLGWNEIDAVQLIGSFRLPEG
jgi:hypothetical protein